MSTHRDYFLAKRVLCEWKIENISLRKHKCMLQSPKFLLSDAYFFIQIYPENIDQSIRYVLIFLCKSFSRTDQQVECTMGIKCADGSVIKSESLNHLFRPEKEDLCFTIRKRSELARDEDVYCPGGTLTVFCEAHVVDNSAMDNNDSSAKAVRQTTSVDNFNKLAKDFEKFFLSGCQTDVVMNVKGEKCFSAHRSILSARSSVFRSMFEVDMKEKETCEVNITDCDPESFGSFLLFLYSGRLDVVSSSNAFSLYASADKYDVVDLKKECCECLIRELSVDSVCDVLRLAALHDEQKLHERATTYFIENASKIVRTLEWRALSEAEPTLAQELFCKVADALRDSVGKTKS